MAAYLTIEDSGAGPTLILGFKSLSIIPPDYVDLLQDQFPGWVDAQLERYSRWIDSRLAKRYATPFEAPPPVAVAGWLADLVTLACYYKRGIDPTDNQSAEIVANARKAEAEVKEAANAVDGLFDLPLRADLNQTGIVKGFPVSYTEASPYTWTDVQRDRARDE